MFKFEKPNYKITEYIENNSYGKFELEPLEKGFGTTIGNALRRVMLSSLPGDAITSVKIDGVLHEFQTIDGVIEDVSMIILNLKNIVLKNHSKEPKTLHLNVSKEGTVHASDIERDADIEIINPDQVIATLAKGGRLNMELTVGYGKGYVRADENKKTLTDVKVGTIAIDALYSPVERISYEVESARVGQNTNFDKLIMHVQTNGAIKPEEAMALASKILIEHLNIVCDLDQIADLTKDFMTEKTGEVNNKILETSIDDLDLSPRAHNCLKRAGLNTIADLTAKSELEIMKIRNLGKKSYTEVLEKVHALGLNFYEEN